jgi:L-asparaginase
VPDIVVVGLGGTISMRTMPGVEGVVPGIDVRDLLDGDRSHEGPAAVETISFRSLPGPHLGLTDILKLDALLKRRFEKGARAAVVVQGTDTIEESAFLLDRLHHGEEPIVVTGAMRHPGLAGADGPGNLSAALRVAASIDVRGLGCLVVMDDEIHAARFVSKAHASRPGGFASTPGPIGFVAEDRVRILSRPGRLVPVPAGHSAAAPRIACLTVCLGDDGGLVTAAVEAGFDGMVLAAMGAGHVPPAMIEAIARARDSFPILIATRTGGGETLRRTYGYAGAEIDLDRCQVIRAGWLPPAKTHALLSLLVAAGCDEPEIRARFADFGGG